MPEGGAYWQKVGLEAVAVIDYTGDDTNNREIPLGDTYDEVRLYPRGNLDNSTGFAAHAWSFRTATTHAYGLIDQKLAQYLRAWVGTPADPYWKGLVASRDAVHLGTNGALDWSTNRNARLYSLVCYRYRSVR